MNIFIFVSIKNEIFHWNLEILVILEWTICFECVLSVILFILSFKLNEYKNYVFLLISFLLHINVVSFFNGKIMKSNR